MSKKERRKGGTKDARLNQGHWDVLVHRLDSLRRLYLRVWPHGVNPAFLRDDAFGRHARAYRTGIRDPAMFARMQGISAEMQRDLAPWLEDEND